MEKVNIKTQMMTRIKTMICNSKIRRTLATGVCPMFSVQFPFHSHHPLRGTAGEESTNIIHFFGSEYNFPRQAEERLFLKELGKKEVESLSRLCHRGISIGFAETWR